MSTEADETTAMLAAMPPITDHDEQDDQPQGDDGDQDDADPDEPEITDLRAWHTKLGRISDDAERAKRTWSYVERLGVQDVDSDVVAEARALLAPRSAKDRLITATRFDKAHRRGEQILLDRVEQARRDRDRQKVPRPAGTGDQEEFPPPSHPMAVARQLLPQWQHAGLLTLLHWRGTWMAWVTDRWTEVDDRRIRADLYVRLEWATYEREGPNGDAKTVAWAPTTKKITDLVNALAGIVHLDSAADSPAWLRRGIPGGPLVTAAPDGPIVSCANGLLDVGSRKLHDHTPEFFNVVSVPFDFAPEAPTPERWLKFLAEIWPDDEASIQVLQEFFGYVISGRTDQQKVLLIVGPTRSGKGTIARILTALIGKGNAAGPTLASLATNFGLSPLLGKPLALISDARIDARGGQQVVEALLRISGEDTIDVDRKYRDPWTGKLPTRFVILSNELPKFGDSSGVIADRFIVLEMEASFLGKEDPGLTDALIAELPGILNWALDGLASLIARGRFVEPSASVEARLTMRDMASPTSAFIRERCSRDRNYLVKVDDLWAAWRTWCDEAGVRTGSKAEFGRNLLSNAPGVRRGKPRTGPIGPDGLQKQEPHYLGIRVGLTVSSDPAHPAQPAHHDTSAAAGGRGEPREPGEPGEFPLWVSPDSEQHTHPSMNPHHDRAAS